MKQFICLFLGVSFFFCCKGQHASLRNIVLTTTEYNDKSVFRVTYDTVKNSNEKIDVYFYREHFYHPSYLPARFTDSHYKDTTLAFWHDNQAVKDTQNNWKNTYTFDSLSHIVTFSYSGCTTCSKMAYTYFVNYNETNQVIRISSLNSNQNSYSFDYNDAGEVKRLNCYISGRLTTVIELVK